MRINTVISALNRCLDWYESDIQKTYTRGNYRWFGRHNIYPIIHSDGLSD